MSYCVHCGVELDDTAQSCPLCSTPVQDPLTPRDTTSPRPYSTRYVPVEPPSKTEVALLLSVMLVSVSVACALLNLFFKPQRLWSLYVVGASITLWLWMVLPLLVRKTPVWVRLLLDGLAVAVYVFLISLDLDGMGWFLGLALPIILTGTALALALSFWLKGRSLLTTLTVLLGAAGLYCLAIEFFVDFYLTALWRPGWSVVAAAICATIMVVLIVVRRVPGLREQARRRFHL